MPSIKKARDLIDLAYSLSHPLLLSEKFSDSRISFTRKLEHRVVSATLALLQLLSDPHERACHIGV